VLQAGDHVYGVDHGVCFHVEPKLRTILWGFIDEPLPDDVAEVLRKLRVDLDGALGEALFEHLMVAEVVVGRDAARRAARDRVLSGTVGRVAVGAMAADLADAEQGAVIQRRPVPSGSAPHRPPNRRVSLLTWWWVGGRPAERVRVARRVRWAVDR